MNLIESGKGDWGVLDGDHISFFESREQAMAYIRWLIELGRSPSLWRAA